MNFKKMVYLLEQSQHSNHHIKFMQKLFQYMFVQSKEIQ